MPAMKFVRSGKYRYRKGRIYLGVSPLLRRSMGVKTERHAITIAGAGSGKGACAIIPNLKRWPHNALVIDPKGEAVKATTKWRRKKGQNVHALVPFGDEGIAKEDLATFNPLSLLDINSLSISEDIQVISDGIVMRGNDQSEHWDDGAQAIISGLIAYVLVKRPPEQQNLIEVRNILRDRGLFWEVIEECKTITECAGIAQSGAGRALAKEGEYFISNADKNTSWLDSDAMITTLSSSSFDLHELKTGKASVFLVLPANRLSQHGRFLRLFVRCALDVMATPLPNGELRDQQCLFVLDEFYSLGYIDEISKAAGLMRGYGLQLWPILQDFGQLITLYGQEGAQTFFGNSDVQQFFGNTDQLTIDIISKMIGTRHTKGFLNIDEEFVGKPFMSPQEIRKHIAKRQNDIVARRMIVFAQGSDVLSVRPKPYFKERF